MIARAHRVRLSIPILYRRLADDHWFSATVADVSESGVLFGPTELDAGAAVEVMLSQPVQADASVPGRQVREAVVVRTTEIGAAAVQFRSGRFLLDG